jgi:hypothetical protein
MTASRTLPGLPRAAAALAFALFLIPAIGTPTAVAQTGLDPATVEVAGVRLGMTPDEAAAALKAFDPAFTITKQYLDHPLFHLFGQVGQPLATFSPAIGRARPAYFNDLSATKGQAVVDCHHQSDPRQCTETHPDDEETITVWFSLVPGQERVIAVERSKRFYKEPHPTIASLMEGVFAKFPKDQISQEQNGWNGAAYTADWLFDSRNRPLSKATAAIKTRGRNQPWGKLPGGAMAGDGKGLSVAFWGDNQNHEIALSIDMVLYDSDALYKSGAQSQAAFAAAKARVDAAEGEKAAGSPSQTKF